MSLLTYTNFDEEMIMRFLDESVTDIKIAFKAYSEYKKAYISIFTRFLIGIIVLIFTAFFIGRFVILEKYFQFDKIIRLTLMLTIPLILPLYFAVLTLPYVLIIVADQMFTLFYLLDLIYSQGNNHVSVVIIKVLVYFFDLVLYITLIEIFPSIIVVRNLKQCFIKNFSVVNQYLKRLILSVGLYYLLFRVPMIIVDIARFLITTSEETFLLFNMIFLIFSFIYALIGLPILSLISTRIYNTTISKTKANGNESNLLGSS